ncbi:reverse transcriptase domain-containing protein [Okeania sp. KiyG1]|uniref:reverse transcriptase domain-containing protein n=1 Tax=Okeania sp. KiyG1 TaxID=2720165 RepID=UPI0035C916F6
MEQCFNKFRNNHSGRHTWVLDADIKGFFDNIAHESILKRIGSFPRGELIRGWLKAGFIDKGVFCLTETGTPQGGVISPLLANIGLHGERRIYKNSQPKARHHQVCG